MAKIVKNWVLGWLLDKSPSALDAKVMVQSSGYKDTDEGERESIKSVSTSHVRPSGQMLLAKLDCLSLSDTIRRV